MATAILTNWNDDDKTITLRREEQTFNESTGGMDIEHLGEITMSVKDWGLGIVAVENMAEDHEHDVN